MRDRRLRLIALFIGLSLLGLGWVLLVACWRWSRIGGWELDDYTI